MCSFLNRLLKARCVRLFIELGYSRSGPTPGTGAPAAACEAFRPGRRRPLSQLSGGLQNESRNGFDYRPRRVFVWWRRLVLGTRARLTRSVLGNSRSGARLVM